MRTSLACLTILCGCWLSGQARAQDDPQDAQAMCEQWAEEEGLDGEARDSYLRRCREESENDSLPAMDPLYKREYTTPSFLGPDAGALDTETDDDTDSGQ